MSRMLEISDETYEKIKVQLQEDEKVNIACYDDLIGKCFYFRTVTYHLVGKVEAIVGKFAILKTASWIADSGRFMNAIKDGTLNEIEPVGQAFVNLESVTDFFPWKHPCPTSQK